MARSPKALARWRTVSVLKPAMPSSRSSTRSAPFPKAIRACRSASAAFPTKITAATLVMSLLRNRLSNRHAEVAAAFLHSQEDLRPDLEVAHSEGSAVDRHESYRFRILDDRGVAAVIDFGFDKEQRSALNLHPTDNDGPRAPFRVHGEHVVAGAQFAEILGCARGQIDVGVDGARVHSKRTRGHVARLDRFGMDQEKAGRTVADEHPLAAPQEGARVDAHPVAEAEGTYRRDFCAHETDGLRERFEEGTNGPDLVRRRGCQENAVRAHFHRLEDQFRFHSIVDLHE